MANPDIRPLTEDTPVIGRENSAVVEGLSPKKAGEKSKTTATVGEQQYKTEFVKVYQDAGVIGVAMLTLLVLCLIMGWFSMRVLRMYTTMLDSRDKAEALRVQFFDKLTLAVTGVGNEVREIKTEIRADHEAQLRECADVKGEVKSLGDRLNTYLFKQLEDPK